MPHINAGGLVYSVPDTMNFNGEDIEIVSSDLSPVWYGDAIEGDDPIGVELHMELPEHGTVIFSIGSDGWNGVAVTAGPFDGDADRVDTFPEPPVSFVEQVSIAPCESDAFEDDPA